MTHSFLLLYGLSRGPADDRVAGVAALPAGASQRRAAASSRRAATSPAPEHARRESRPADAADDAEGRERSMRARSPTPPAAKRAGDKAGAPRGGSDRYGRISTFSEGWKLLFAVAIAVYQERLPPASPWQPASLRLWMP